MRFDQIQEILSNARVGIAGAGGLGSNCAHALVRSGLGSLVIADFDTVELSNLNRQFYFHDQLGKIKVDVFYTIKNLCHFLPSAPVATSGSFNTSGLPSLVSL